MDRFMVRGICATVLSAVLLGVLVSSASAAAPGVVLGARGASGTSVDAVQKTNDLGVGWVRLFVDWAALEPSKGKDSPLMGQLQATIGSLKAAGKHVDAVVFSTPPWANGGKAANVPPTNASDYAQFITRLIGETGGSVDAWEIWNEPDGGEFWAGKPNPVRYTQLLKAAYPAIKAADPDAIVVTGGLVGNDYDFVSKLYKAGARGFFDAVGVHTDNACLQAAPDYYYRDPGGQVGRYTFTAYREVHYVMAANGDDAKPIWMTELGWSTTAGTCEFGGRAGQQKAGVSESKQAAYLKRAFQCLAQDPYVQVALWFSLQDIDAKARPGLIRNNASAKPSYGALKGVARGVAPGKFCGGRADHGAPTVSITKPAAGGSWTKGLNVIATAKDPEGSKIRKMQLFVDGKRIKLGAKNGRLNVTYGGAKKLRKGTHTVTVKAFDEAGNVGSASVTAVKK